MVLEGERREEKMFVHPNELGMNQPTRTLMNFGR